jgi:hypothetical protein
MMKILRKNQRLIAREDSARMISTDIPSFTHALHVRSKIKKYFITKSVPAFLSIILHEEKYNVEISSIMKTSAGDLSGKR